ncbi:MAG TPA: alpha/beta hydrolase [Gryllotalpicola sp.]
MPSITTSDGTDIYYVDHGAGRPVLFSHGWPLSSDAWQPELKRFADAGFRVVAHDRRGHGRSGKTFTGNDIDTFARDLSELVEVLDLRDLVLVGHSAAGGGEVVRYAARYGTGRVAKVVTIGADVRNMVRSETNPEGLPAEVFDGLRAGLLNDHSQFWKDLAVTLYGAGRDGSQISQGVLDDFWRQGLLTNLAAAYDGIAAFSETDQREELAAIDVPVLIAHGDADQIVPVAAAHAAAQLAKNGMLKVYPGAPHGISGAFREQLIADILEFIAA